MRLAPIFPSHPRFTVRCAVCNDTVDSLHGFADLDVTGRYLCPVCANGPGHRQRRHLEHAMLRAHAELDRAREEGRERLALTEAHAKACDRYHGSRY